MDNTVAEFRAIRGRADNAPRCARELDKCRNSGRRNRPLKAIDRDGGCVEDVKVAEPFAVADLCQELLDFVENNTVQALLIRHIPNITEIQISKRKTIQ